MNIKVKEAAVSYESRYVFEHVTATFKEGGITMLIGPNGSGKTTLLKSIMGLLKMQKGCVYYGKKTLKEISIRERSRLVAYMPQQRHIPEGYPVVEYVLLGMTPYLTYFATPSASHMIKAEEILKELEIYDLRNRRLDSLSGGERQLVNFARARAQDTKWLLLDEPMAALDYNRQHEFMHRLKVYEKMYGQSILLTVHDPGMALQYADQVQVLGKGKLLGTAARVENNFENKLTGLLNQAYDGHLQLIENTEGSFYRWKEEAYVSGKELYESSQS